MMSCLDSAAACCPVANYLDTKAAWHAMWLSRAHRGHELSSLEDGPYYLNPCRFPCADYENVLIEARALLLRRFQSAP